MGTGNGAPIDPRTSLKVVRVMIAFDDLSEVEIIPTDKVRGGLNMGHAIEKAQAGKILLPTGRKIHFFQVQIEGEVAEAVQLTPPDTHSNFHKLVDVAKAARAMLAEYNREFNVDRYDETVGHEIALQEATDALGAALERLGSPE